MEAELIGISGLGGAGVVLAVVEVLRRTIGVGIIKDRFTPILAIGVGIGLNVLLKLDSAIGFEETTWTGTALLGVLTGLSASGMYSFGKNVINGGQSESV